MGAVPKHRLRGPWSVEAGCCPICYWVRHADVMEIVVTALALGDGGLIDGPFVESLCETHRVEINETADRLGEEPSAVIESPSSSSSEGVAHAPPLREPEP